MSRVCQVTGKRPMSGNNRSHAMNATKRRFLPNLHSHRFWVEGEKRFVTLRVSAKGMRVIDKRVLKRSWPKFVPAVRSIKELNHG